MSITLVLLGRQNDGSLTGKRGVEFVVNGKQAEEAIVKYHGFGPGMKELGYSDDEIVGARLGQVVEAQR